MTMNELDLIKESVQNELKNPQNYERLVQQGASSIANLLILKPVLETLNNSIEKLKQKNQLKRNHKKILNSNVIELLKMLDDPNLNESNVILIQKLIIISLSKEVKPSEELLSKEYLKVAKSLNSSEIVVLQAAYEVQKQGNNKDNLDIDDIYKELAMRSGLKFSDIIAQNYKNLEDKKLFKSPWNRENTQISDSDGTYVLTDLGLAFMQYIEIYEKLEK